MELDKLGDKRTKEQGICWDCEMEIPSSREELLEAHRYLKDTMHMYVASGELISALPDEGSFNLEQIFREIGELRAKSFLKQYGYNPEAEYISRFYNDLKEHVGYIVVAAARMKQENTPRWRKIAAKSIYLRGDIRRAQRGMGSKPSLADLEKENGKWYWKV
jgi:hypothetical protein